MPFDANLVLIDGTIDVDSDTATTFAVPTSTTRLTATGAAVLDIKETGVKGLAAVLVIPALSSSTDYLTATIQISDEEDFANSVYNLQEVVKFDIAAATLGRILASECIAGAVVVRRFVSDKRYVRAVITPTKSNGDGSFSTLQILLSPYPFKVL